MRIVYPLLPLTLALLASNGACGATPATFERHVAADPHGIVEISSTSGTIDVAGWARAEVGVRAELGEDVDHVEVTSEHGRTSIRVMLRPHASVALFSLHRDETHLHVKVPKDSELDVSTVSADVTSDGVQGIQRLKTVSGGIVAEIGPADVEAKSVSGDIRLRGHAQPARLHVSTVSGDVRLEHAAGDLETTTVSGTITVALDPARSVRARSTSGDIRFEGRLTRGADFEAQSVSGDLKVRAASEDGFQYEAATMSGDISDCFNVAPERSSKYGPGHTLNGSRGAGGAHVRLKTLSGELTLCDHT
ncbi:MAG: DUF4097 family beta strand repeat-containing protein [Steroidobacteraceae bacterium]